MMKAYSFLIIVIVGIGFGYLFTTLVPSLNGKSITNEEDFFKKNKENDNNIIETKNTIVKETKLKPLKDSLNRKINLSRRNGIVNAIEKTWPAVVFIGVKQLRVVRGRSTSFYSDPVFDFFRKEYLELFPVVGSGVIIEKDGTIITNYHVIENAVDIVAQLPDGREYTARVLASHIPSDIAILKIEGENLPFLSLGNSDDLLIGEWAIAIGNPFGSYMSDLKPTVTVGVISAINRNFTQKSGVSYYNVIQTDASINPGNSGGPLINLLGEVIGINTFIFSKNKGSVGLNFSIPSNRISKILKEVKKYGRIRAFSTGLSVKVLTPYIAEISKLKIKEGLIVTGINKESCGEKAGLLIKDIIYKVNNKKIRRTKDVNSILENHFINDKIKLSILRQNKFKDLILTLEAKKEDI